jgi:hypothetical protein
MIVGPVDGVVATREVPRSVRELSSLPDPDYVDLFTLSTSASTTPERWARAMFGDVPSVTERLIWRGPECSAAPRPGSRSVVRLILTHDLVRDTLTM